MKLTLIFLSFFAFILTAHSQIRGTVVDKDGNGLSAVSIRIQNSYIGTSSNTKGEFELPQPKESKVTLIFQRLGFKTLEQVIVANQFNTQQKITLNESALDIDEVIINTKTNPADNIIRKAIANRKKNARSHDKYEADFYSKGSFNLVNMPKRIFGMKIESDQDSINTGIIYLSETISKIKVERPNKIHEKIIASKVSGDSRGLSFNRAEGTDFELYSNYLDFGPSKIITPIADQAFSYYKFRLENSFEEEGRLIHKIKVLPKRNTEPVLEGYIYIDNDNSQIYALDALILGSRANIEFIDSLQITQQYGFHQQEERWIKQLQTLNFTAGLLGIKFQGYFNHTFSNYKFVDAFDANTFGRVISEFDVESTTKKEDYWTKNRQIPLTELEIKDYLRKDSIATVKESSAYKDSVDLVANKFEIIDLIKGYRYQNSIKKYNISYLSPISIARTSFNTVHGWNFKSGLEANIGDRDSKNRLNAVLLVNYGLADKQLYLEGNIKNRFNKINYATLELKGGTAVKQFNSSNPISPFINSVYSLLFKDNFMKLYKEDFLSANYSQYLHPNWKLNTSFGYSQRSNLYNAAKYQNVATEKSYVSNNPLDPMAFNSDAFVNHHLFRANINIDIFFKTKINKLPAQYIYRHSNRYPMINLSYTNAFASNEKNYNFQEVKAKLSQDISLGNKGLFGYQMTAGKFFNADNISFVDYKHFNGNQTHLNTNTRYLNNYLMLPYYAHSRNKSYLELHTEHHFKGFLMNKIPGISALKWQTIVGYHLLASENRKPYQEFSVGFNNIGWGKYRFLRVDYVQSKNGISPQNNFVVGLSLFNMFQ